MKDDARRLNADLNATSAISHRQSSVNRLKPPPLPLYSLSFDRFSKTKKELRLEGRDWFGLLDEKKLKELFRSVLCGIVANQLLANQQAGE